MYNINFKDRTKESTYKRYKLGKSCRKRDILLEQSIKNFQKFNQFAAFENGYQCDPNMFKNEGNNDGEKILNYQSMDEM